MSDFTLYITHKNYSSWSLRAWLLMHAFGIEFDEVQTPMNNEGVVPGMADISPTGKVPCLVVRPNSPNTDITKTDIPGADIPGVGASDLTIWDTLAITEYLAETFPQHSIWPKSSTDRARARSLVAEMHSGFNGLRNECPMNLRRQPNPLNISAAARADVARIEEIFATELATSNGPFLMGEFSALDAFYAPIYVRLTGYALSSHSAVQQFGAVLTRLPAWREWTIAAASDTSIVAADEA